MNKGGRPRLYNGNPARRIHISVPDDLWRELEAAKSLNASAVCTAALNKHLADKVFLDAAKEIICTAVAGVEKRLDTHGVLGPEDRLAFAKIRGIIFAIEGDAYIKRVKVDEIRALSLPNNGGSAKPEPDTEAST